MKINSRWILFTAILVIVTTLCKYYFGPNLNWSGFSPIIAISLFSGMLINDKGRSFLLPLIAVFASDILIELLYVAKLFPYSGFYTWQFFNYGLILAVTLLGWALKGKNYGSLIGGVFAAPTLFFLISNCGAWIIDTGHNYTGDFKGLMDSYAAGLPFYKRALAATFIFLPAILLTYNYTVKGKTALKLA